jgi:hypothetical protein
VIMRPRRSTGVLVALFVLLLVTCFIVRPAPAVTYPYYPATVTNSPTESRSRPTLHTTSTEPARPSTTAVRSSPLSSNGAPAPSPTVAPTTMAQTTTPRPFSAGADWVGAGNNVAMIDCLATVTSRRGYPWIWMVSEPTLSYRRSARTHSVTSVLHRRFV